MNDQPTGVPRHWDPDRDFISVSRESIANLGPVNAIVLHHIIYRCKFHDRGYWEASVETIAEETGIPQRTVERAVKALREGGRIASKRAHAYDATQTWQVLWADGGHETADVADGDRRPGGHPSANVAVTSSKTKRPSKNDRARSTSHHPRVDAQTAARYSGAF